MAQEGADSSKKRFLEMYRQHPIPLPTEYYKGEKACDAAEKLIHNTLVVNARLESMPYSLDTLDWNVHFSAQGSTFLLYLQGLTPVEILVNAYTQTAHLPYLEQARKFVESWAAYARNKVRSVFNKYCWYDHTVSLRTATFIHLGRVAAERDLWEDDFYDVLFRLLEVHGAWLNRDDKYAEHHNHGIMQDQALLYAGVFFQRRDWISHGMERLSRQAEWAFNAEGVHKENSSGYALMVSRLLQKIHKFLVDVGETPAQTISDAAQRSKEYLEWCTMPNGLLVQIGDTQRQVMPIPSPSSCQKFYPEAGMYFYRSKAQRHPGAATWKVIKAGYVNTEHKHCDDNSFVLYGKGHEIFSDCGIYGYAKDRYRAYFLSAKAHNTVVVDDGTYLCSAKKCRETGMLGHRAFPRYDHVRMFQNSYSGVQFIRDFCSADDLTVLMDTLTSGQNHTYSQLFHLSEDMQLLEVDDEGACIQLADTGYLVRLRQWGGGTAFSLIRGDLSVPDYGLISRGTGQMAVTTTLKFDITAENALFATTITIEDADGFVRLGGRKARAEDLRYDASTQTFMLGTLTVPCTRPLPEH